MNCSFARPYRNVLMEVLQVHNLAAVVLHFGWFEEGGFG